MQGTVTGAVYVNPLEVRLSLEATVARVGVNVKAHATASNLGSHLLSDVEMTLRTDPSGVDLASAATRVIDVGSGATRSVTWPLCGSQPGSYVMLAQGTFANAVGHLVTSESSAAVLDITPSARGRCPGMQ